MSISTRVACALSAPALSIAFAGCGGGSIAPSASQSNADIGALRQRSWIAPNARSSTLLYVSNEANNTVAVYSFASGTLVGTLFGFDEPAGLCVGKAGAVFIADSGSGKIFEYPHGKYGPPKILSDPYGHPLGCSVDPTTGNLAVADAENGVLIYTNASGSPTRYSGSGTGFLYYYYLGYDNQGNLYVDGASTSAPIFGLLPKGGSTIVEIFLEKEFVTAGSLQWDGKYLAVCDIGVVPNVVYQFSMSDRLGTLQGTTTLDGTHLIAQFWIPNSGTGQGTTIVGADSSVGNVPYWNYPAGGNATMTIPDSSTPSGVAVSKGRSY